MMRQSFPYLLSIGEVILTERGAHAVGNHFHNFLLNLGPGQYLLGYHHILVKSGIAKAALQMVVWELGGNIVYPVQTLPGMDPALMSVNLVKNIESFLRELGNEEFASWCKHTRYLP